MKTRPKRNTHKERERACPKMKHLDWNLPERQTQPQSQRKSVTSHNRRGLRGYLERDDAKKLAKIRRAFTLCVCSCERTGSNSFGACSNQTSLRVWLLLFHCVTSPMHTDLDSEWANFELRIASGFENSKGDQGGSRSPP